ncbi:YfcE-like metallophosphoesterase [[Mycoplasma] cavipharyngis]|uniref:YfcE family phosphodiesterase n=1 Tax=[Mycoplasma] cavipharyngis TaxID=92757 RepID=UPI00370438D1
MKNMKVTILVVSDNHGSLDNIHHLIKKKQYDAILHAGDYTCNCQDVLLIHPKTYFTLGNNDFAQDIKFMSEDGIYYPKDNAYVITIANYKFVIVHGHLQLEGFYQLQVSKFKQLAKKYHAQFVIFGQTHIPTYHQVDQIHILNPGSINFPRSNMGKTYAEIEFENDQPAKVTICRF